jgi:cytochrome c553
MNLVAAQLSDRDIEDLAAWYSSIEVTLGKVPGG